MKGFDNSAINRSRLRFTRLRDYVRAILNTVRDPLIVLDEGFKVKMVNKSFCQTFRVSRRKTNNQRIETLGNGQWKIPKLRTLLEGVFSANSQIQNFEVDHQFPSIGRRTMLLSARRLEIVGSSKRLILLTIEDITVRRQAEHTLAKVNATIKSNSITDNLTGLYNQRGYSTMGRQYLELANRRSKQIIVIFADLDGLKQINDRRGHSAGDQTLVHAANILRETFRKSDIIARIGGDEFAIITMENGHDSVATQMVRLQRNLKRHAAQNGKHATISFSMGISHSDPKKTCTIEDLTAKADTLMYIEKRNKQRYPITMNQPITNVA